MKKKTKGNGRMDYRGHSKRPETIDQYVGLRVRAQRATRGLSQHELAEELGVTFQQVQKYERGLNRIGAGRLFQIAEILDVPVSFFYEDVVGRMRRSAVYPNGNGISEASRTIQFATSPEGLALIRAYQSIADMGARKHLFQLIRAVAAINK